MKSGIARSVLLLRTARRPPTLGPPGSPAARDADRERQTKVRRLLFAAATLVQVVSITAAISGSAVAGASAGPCAPPAELAGGPDHLGMVWIEGDAFTMGSDEHHPEERAPHEVTLEGFWIDRHEVTNAQFARFVAVTGLLNLVDFSHRPAEPLWA